MSSYEFGILAEPASYSTNAKNYEMGWLFTVVKDVYLCGFRVKAPSSVSKVCKLWDATSQSLLTFASLTTVAGEWVEVLIDGGFLLKAGKDYIISTWTDGSYYSSNSSNFTFNTKYITFKNGKAGTSKDSYPNTYTETIMYPVIDCLLSEDAPTRTKYSNNYYYNGVWLPKIPEDVLAEFPYCWMNDLHNGTYSLIVAKQPWYYASGNMNLPSTAENRKYTLSSKESFWSLANTYNDTGGYSVTDANVLWVSHDIPNGSTTATNVYFASSIPTNRFYKLSLVDSKEAESGTLTSPAIVVDRADYSKNIVVDGIGSSGGSFSLNFSVQSDDFYVIRMFFTHDGARDFKYVVNDKTYIKKVTGTSYYTIEHIDFQMYLKAGDNLVEFSGNTTTYAPMFDKFEIYSIDQMDDYQYDAVCTEVTSDTILTASINAVANSWVLATVAVRSEFTAPDGWKVLHESGIIALDQRLILLCKYVKQSAIVSFTATQATAGRIYINLIAWQNISGFKYHEGSEFLDNETTATSYTVNRPQLDTIIWMATKPYWTTSSPHPAWTVSGLSDIIQLPNTTQQRLMNAIDDDTTVPEREFTAAADTAGIIIDYVEVKFEPPSEKRFLIESDGILYTIVDSVLTVIENTSEDGIESNLSAEIFLQYGFLTAPEWDVIKDLVNPKIYYWDADTDADWSITANITAVPYPQTFISQLYSMKHESILGIDYVSAVASEGVLFEVSFDGGVTWKSWIDEIWVTIDNPTLGMSANTVNAIPSDAWNDQTINMTLRFRMTLFTVRDYFTNLIVHYINPEQEE